MSSDRIAGHALSWAAGQFRDRTAVVFRDRSYSYTQIERRSNQLANALVGLGRAPGERLGVLLNNSVESIEAPTHREPKKLAAFVREQVKRAEEERARSEMEAEEMDERARAAMAGVWRRRRAKKDEGRGPAIPVPQPQSPMRW